MMEWISVNERLPCGYVMVDDETKEPAEYIVHVKHAEFATVAYFVGGKFISLDGRKWCSEIDYWMEMPESPKE